MGIEPGLEREEVIAAGWGPRPGAREPRGLTAAGQGWGPGAARGSLLGLGSPVLEELGCVIQPAGVSGRRGAARRPHVLPGKPGGRVCVVAKAVTQAGPFPFSGAPGGGQAPPTAGLRPLGPRQLPQPLPQARPLP